MKKILLIAGVLISGLALAAASTGPANANTRQPQCLKVSSSVLKPPQQSRPAKIAKCDAYCCANAGGLGVCVRWCCR
jgi:hypothetical protein